MGIIGAEMKLIVHIKRRETWLLIYAVAQRLSGSVFLSLPQGGFTACHWPSIVLGTLREGVPVTTAVVSTAMGVSSCF